MLNGVDLFSGIGGLSLAMSPWVRPIAYCENDRYAQGVLLSRMWSGELPSAGIWDDITTLVSDMLPGNEIDIIYGGFPCQDISVAGAGKGLGGERSGLFFHIARLVEEINPRFVFLENVPAIRTRGLNSVVQTFTELGYDCRWTVVSAAEVGAPHLRKRWFMLAHSQKFGHPWRRLSAEAHGQGKRRDSRGIRETIPDQEKAFALGDLLRNVLNVVSAAGPYISHVEGCHDCASGTSQEKELKDALTKLDEALK